MRPLARPRPAILAAALVGAILLLWGARHAGTALVVSRPLDALDAIVPLASKEWERLPVAAALARQHPGARVLLTLPRRVSQYNCHDCYRRTEWLEAAGVDVGRVEVVPIAGGGTYGEADGVARLAKARNLRRLAVVTSAYHTRRALATFEHAVAGSGVQIGIYPAESDASAGPARWWRKPYDRWYVRYEWMAILYYALRHGVVHYG
jgi:uncharacterized SAM-binding protein YcdF (DUF218 family)